MVLSCYVVALLYEAFCFPLFIFCFMQDHVVDRFERMDICKPVSHPQPVLRVQDLGFAYGILSLGLPSETTKYARILRKWYW